MLNKNKYKIQIFRTQKSFLEVFYKSSHSTLINAVMKCLNFRRSTSKSERILLKVELRKRYFLKNFAISAEQRHWKIHQDSCFWGHLYFRNIPQWLLLKGSCKNIFILEIQGYTFYISYSDFMLKRNELLWTFFKWRFQRKV